MIISNAIETDAEYLALLNSYPEMAKHMRVRALKKKWQEEGCHFNLAQKIDAIKQAEKGE